MDLLRQLDPSALIIDDADYRRRAIAAVALVADSVGLAAAVEAARFAGFWEALTAQPAPPPASLFAAVSQGAAQMSPLSVELALSFRGGKARGFGYLTQGVGRESVPATMRLLMREVLRLYLDGKGDADLGVAQQLADTVAAAFPDMAALERFSGAAQALICAVVPRGDRVELKSYCNTRMLVDGDHAARVARVAAVAGIDPELTRRVYRALYCGDARFAGVGVDHAASAPGRAKLYVRVATDAARAHASALAAALGIAWDPKGVTPLCDPDVVAGETELAVALASDGGATLKWTAFYPADTASLAALRWIEETLRDQGGDGSDVAVLTDAVKTLSRKERCVERHFPLHGVGLEFPASERPKLNAYLQPAR